MDFKILNLITLRQRGFTLFEVLIVLALLSIMVAIVLFSFSNLRSKKILENNTSLVAAILGEARSLTLSAREASQYGVYLESGQVTLFQGSVYSPLGPGNVVTPLSSQVNISNISLSGGGNSVVFSRLTGETSNHGFFEISLVSSSSTLKTVTISGTGVIESSSY